jgi:hypothetical protein
MARFFCFCCVLFSLNQDNFSGAWVANKFNPRIISSVGEACCLLSRLEYKGCMFDSRRLSYRALSSLRGGSVEASKDDTIVSRLKNVLNEISSVSEELKRPPPRLVAVSKFQSEESILEAYNAGQVIIFLGLQA